jgi:hypothetical protein
LGRVFSNINKIVYATVSFILQLQCIFTIGRQYVILIIHEL